MAQLDRLGWAAGLAFEVYGLRIGVRVNTPDILSEVEQRLPPRFEPIQSDTVDHLYSVRLGGEGPRPGLRRFHLLYANSARLGRTHERHEIFDLLEDDLKLTVALAARDRLFVHAGVVAWRDQAILIPGPSRAGKSTLVAALVQAGATYYSDEFAVLDADGYVHPYPRPLALREPGEARSRPWPIEDARRIGNRPLPVGLVVFTHYRPDSTGRRQSMPRGQAALKLLSNTTAARYKPAVALATLQRITSHATLIQGARGEATPYAERLLKWWERRVSPSLNSA